MKPTVLRAVAVVFAVCAMGAGVYKWVDEEGRTIYSDAPPSGKAAKELELAPQPPKEQLERAQQKLEKQRHRQQPGSLLPGENLQFRIPTGFIPGFEQRTVNRRFIEFIPLGQGVNDWTEMITVVVHLGSPMTLDQLQTYYQKMSGKGCTDYKFTILRRARQNGYDFLTYSLSCAFTEKTGKPEFSWHKAIRGNDSLYLVSKAFSYRPSTGKIAEWIDHLEGTLVCDTRLADRQCVND